MTACFWDDEKSSFESAQKSSRSVRSVIEDKLLGIDERPEDVVENLFGLGAFGIQKSFQLRQFIIGRLAAEAAKVQITYHLFRSVPLLQQALDQTAILDFFLECISVQQVQGLG